MSTAAPPSCATGRGSARARAASSLCFLLQRIEMQEKNAPNISAATRRPMDSVRGP